MKILIGLLAGLLIAIPATLVAREKLFPEDDMITVEVPYTGFAGKVTVYQIPRGEDFDRCYLLEKEKNNWTNMLFDCVD